MSAPNPKGSLRSRTPCAGRCSTTYGDLVCRGCKRFAHEIVAWNRYDDVAKDAVWQRLLMLRDQVVAGRIEVVNRTLLEAQLRQHRIVFAAADSDASRVWLLLHRGARHMRSLASYGLRAMAPFDAMSPLALRDLIDSDYQRLSEAHYERYFALPAAMGETGQ
ncbi:MAG: DUF1289 domain-containing protein [Gammaproteobacteria bacterium]|nr:DUF1289 domain-containing protein [Gammaproteobacteria bacterium]